METELVTKNTLRYINTNQIHDHLGVKVCMALPAFHVFSGCDNNSSFNWKDKVRPLKLLEKYESTQREFSKLNEWDPIAEDNIQVVEGFVCAIYGKKEVRICRRIASRTVPDGVQAKQCFFS